MHAATPQRCGSDVNGLLLGRQQSVHGCWHCLHVDLRVESHVSWGWSGASELGPLTIHGFQDWSPLAPGPGGPD